MRIWLLIMLLLLFGCVQTELVGITPDTLPIGKEVNTTVQLISKDQCIFGYFHWVYTVKDTTQCSNLTKNAYYRLQGKVSGYTQYKPSGMLGMVDVNLITRYGKSISISSPIISPAILEKVSPAYAVVDEIAWSSEQNKTISLECSPNTDMEKLGFVSENGTEYHYITVLKDSLGSDTVELKEISFGTYSPENSSYILVKTREDPRLEPASLDHILKIKNQFHACYHLANESGFDYFYCRVFQRMGPSDPMSFLVSYYRDRWFCSGATEIN